MLIKKCNSCNNKPNLSGYKHTWLVTCSCGASIGIGTTRFGAIRMWNRRIRMRNRIERIESSEIPKFRGRKISE